MVCVMVLGYSRRVFLRFYLNARTDNFIHEHVDAFNRWQACPRVCCYDNLKSAVLECDGTAIRYNPRLIELAVHYQFKTRAMIVFRDKTDGAIMISAMAMAAKSTSDERRVIGPKSLRCAGESLDKIISWPGSVTFVR